MSDDVPLPGWQEMLFYGGWQVLVAGIARALHHYGLVQLGQRRLWSWSLIWELPTAALCAVIGTGAAEWAGIPLDSPQTSALVGVVAMLGPRGIESAVARLLGHYYPTRPEK